MYNTYFKHKCFPKYIRMVQVQVEVEVKSMIDVVFVKKDLLRYVQDVSAVEGMG